MVIMRDTTIVFKDTLKIWVNENLQSQTFSLFSECIEIWICFTYGRSICLIFCIIISVDRSLVAVNVDIVQTLSLNIPMWSFTEYWQRRWYYFHFVWSHLTCKIIIERNRNKIKSLVLNLTSLRHCGIIFNRNEEIYKMLCCDCRESKITEVGEIELFVNNKLKKKSRD